MRVDLLCSGSKGNSCLVRSGDHAILIDCGSTKKYLMNALERENQKVNDLDALLVTHAHKDHISQLKHFSKLPVYSYCELEGVSDHRIIVPLQEFDIEGFHIQTIGLSHDSPNTVGFVIYAEGEKLVYITDTGYIPNDEKKYLENADTYIFESNHDVEMLMSCSRPMFLKQRILGDNGHLNNLDSSINLSQLVNTKTKNIILAHVSEEANRPDIAYSSLESTFQKKDLPFSKLNVAVARQFESLKIK